MLYYNCTKTDSTDNTQECATGTIRREHIMASAKNTFWNRTKFLWIGGIIGVAQQLLGRLDFYLYRGHDVFSFSGIFGLLSFYAMFILIIMKRDVPAKQQFKDLFLFFLGLDFFYYLYVFVLELAKYLLMDTHPDALSLYFTNSLSETIDFVKWTLIGTAAGLWVACATKCRAQNKRVLFWLMVAPLFAVILFELVLYSFSLYNYIMQEYRRFNDLPLPENSFYCCQISQLLTALTALIVSLRLYLHQKPAFPIRRIRTGVPA